MKTKHPRGGLFTRLYAMKTARFRELARRELYSALWYGCSAWLFSRTFPGLTGGPLSGVLVVVSALVAAAACSPLVSGTDVYVMEEYFAEEEKADGTAAGLSKGGNDGA